MYGALHGHLPGLWIAAIAAPTVADGDVDPYHVPRVVGRVETPAAKHTRIVGAAGAASVRSFPSLEYVAASLSSCGLGVFSALNGPLGVAKFGRRIGTGREEKAHVFGPAPGHCPEEAIEKVFLCAVGVSVSVLRRERHQQLAELPFLRRHRRVHLKSVSNPQRVTAWRVELVLLGTWGAGWQPAKNFGVRS